tara:strand:+ start:114 stop:776 length:663 start_codon:yes stop_codon:yes gene_type:complete
MFLITKTFYKTIMNRVIQEYINNLIKNFDEIINIRKSVLLNVSKYINENILKNQKVNLMFICTHNSRRSQLAQVWSYVAFNYYKLEKIKVFSGGTEVDKFNSNAIYSLINAGLIIKKINKNEFLVKTCQQEKGLKCYSKQYNSENNPKNNFIAIMTCSDADKKCPVLKGANKKIVLPYKDPKVSEGLENEKKTYDQSCFYIAKEMFFIMKNVKRRLNACS